MKITPEVAPDRMDYREAAHLRSYAALCRRLHTGWLGEFVAREFEMWAELGYAADPAGLLWRVAADLDEQVHAQLRAERDRWAAQTACKPAQPPVPPVTPAPPRTTVRDALRAAQDGVRQAERLAEDSERAGVHR